MSFPVVAFLQNCWFKPNTPRHIIDSYLTDQRYRRAVLARSMSGRRLERAFGAHFREIWWDNASQGVGVVPGAKFAPDSKHMHSIISQVKPRAVVCFGHVAMQGYTGIMAAAAMAEPDDTVPLPIGHEFSKAEPSENYTYARGWVPLPWHVFPHPNAFGIKQSQIDEFAGKIISSYF